MESSPSQRCERRRRARKAPSALLTLPLPSPCCHQLSPTPSTTTGGQVQAVARRGFETYPCICAAHREEPPKISGAPYTACVESASLCNWRTCFPHLKFTECVYTSTARRRFWRGDRTLHCTLKTAATSWLGPRRAPAARAVAATARARAGERGGPAGPHAYERLNDRNAQPRATHSEAVTWHARRPHSRKSQCGGRDSTRLDAF